MKKPILSLTVLGLAASLFAIPVVKAGGNTAERSASTHTSIISTSTHAAKAIMAEAVEAAGAALYERLGLAAMGLSKQTLQYAYKGYAQLAARGAVRNNTLTVVDFSQSSRKKRMYIIDMDKEEVLLNTYVAHGKNSGLDYANKFSNRMSSLQSSLGFYVTENTYFGKHGLSLRLEGLERGYNDKAMERAIVVHGANYIGEHRRNSGYNGRSFGCPAVPAHQSKKVINWIKEGSILFIYHPSNGYLHGSKLLNG
ncbi:MAG TPA: murein L,D-transpeptidase catalytic domain family protein [Chitinophagaceae bacterium]